jgi:hypothetical protein
VIGLAVWACLVVLTVAFLTGLRFLWHDQRGERRRERELERGRLAAVPELERWHRRFDQATAQGDDYDTAVALADGTGVRDRSLWQPRPWSAQQLTEALRAPLSTGAASRPVPIPAPHRFEHEPAQPLAEIPPTVVIQPDGSPVPMPPLELGDMTLDGRRVEHIEIRDGTGRVIASVPQPKENT